MLIESGPGSFSEIFEKGFINHSLNVERLAKEKRNEAYIAGKNEFTVHGMYRRVSHNGQDRYVLANFEFRDIRIGGPFRFFWIVRPNQGVAEEDSRGSVTGSWSVVAEELRKRDYLTPDEFLNLV